MKKRFFILAVLGLVLAGCGQKGPLFKPAPAQNNQHSEPKS
ncbi:LPS translocon maturation chaperone LptM [Gallaecimonas mangrovi]|nr:lipoprotein [Gallaecimonas mangrovi]